MTAVAGPSEERIEIAFFDVETTVPTRPGQGFALLEFGAIVVCPRKLEELRTFTTLIRPANPSLINSLSVRCNGITPESVSNAPSFAEIADTVYEILHGRIWAGHNIVRFDCVRIREAFAEIGRPAPEPKGTFDSLALLTQKFGRRAGNMKMATLASYFGLGKQSHRSLEDVRMNLEVLKYCATVLFLESSLPESFPENSWVSPNAITRSRANGKSPTEEAEISTPASSDSNSVNGPVNVSPASNGIQRNHPISSLLAGGNTEGVEDQVSCNAGAQDPFNMRTLSSEINTESLQLDVPMEETPTTESSKVPLAVSQDFNGCVLSNIRPLSSEMNTEAIQSDVPMEEIPITESSEVSPTHSGFIDPKEVSVPSITASFSSFRGDQRMFLLHNNGFLRLYCPDLRVRFGLSSKFSDQGGRPRLNFVVHPSADLCKVLDACDDCAHELYEDSGRSSEWRRVVTRKSGFANHPTLRLHIPTAVSGDTASYATEIHLKEPSGTTQKLVFSKFDPAELEAWFNPGTIVDACLTLVTYDYPGSAGIKLVSNKLIIHSKS